MQIASSRLGPRRCGLLVQAALFAWAVACAGEIRAQGLRVEARNEAVLTASDNPFFVLREQASSDFVLALRPRLTLRRLARGLAIDAEVGADLVGHSNNSAHSYLTPFVRGAFRSELLERALYLDGSVDITRVEADAFAARTSEVSNLNRRLLISYRLSPYVDRAVSDSISFKARSDITRSTLPEERNATSEQLERRDLVTWHNAARFESLPRPFGAALEAESDHSGYSDAEETLLNTSSARAIVAYAPNDEHRLELFAGREKSHFSGTTDIDTVRGARYNWKPGIRSELDVRLERRFFGTDARISFTHRMPWLSANFGLHRTPVSNPFGIKLVGSGNNLAEFLDAILVTRYPDPVERSKLVSDLLQSRGLPGTLTRAVDLVAKYAQLEEGGNIGLVFLGQRNVVTITAFAVRFTELNRVRDPVVAGFALNNDNRQVGATFGFNRRLSPLTSLDLSITGARTLGLAERAGDITTQYSARLAMTQVLSPRTNASFGIADRHIKTNVGDVPRTYEITIFCGLTNAF